MHMYVSIMPYIDVMSYTGSACGHGGRGCEWDAERASWRSVWQPAATDRRLWVWQQLVITAISHGASLTLHNLHCVCVYIGLLVIRCMEPNTTTICQRDSENLLNSATASSPSLYCTLWEEVGICHMIIMWSLNCHVIVMWPLNYHVIVMWPLMHGHTGTGSGVGTKILEILKDEFPSVYRSARHWERNFFMMYIFILYVSEYM